MKIFLASTNKAKIGRYKNLLKYTGFEVEVFTPEDFGLENVVVKETGETLLENALLKAKSYEGKINMSILANDTGFWVEGGGFALAPKRMAMAGQSEEKISKQEVAKNVLEFWQNLATKHKGRLDAAWKESFVLLNTDGKIYNADSKREMILTNEIVGTPNPELPVRALYVSKASGKRPLLHTEQEELLEMQTLVKALKELLQKLYTTIFSSGQSPH